MCEQLKVNSWFNLDKGMHFVHSVKMHLRNTANKLHHKDELNTMQLNPVDSEPTWFMYCVSVHEQKIRSRFSHTGLFQFC